MLDFFFFYLVYLSSLLKLICTGRLKLINGLLNLIFTTGLHLERTYEITKSIFSFVWALVKFFWFIDNSSRYKSSLEKFKYLICPGVDKFLFIQTKICRKFSYVKIVKSFDICTLIFLKLLKLHGTSWST